MTTIQKLIKRLLPTSWSSAIESESRSWWMVCNCGRAISVWDAGGVRYKAYGNPRVLARCPKCGLTMHRLEYRKAL